MKKLFSLKGKLKRAPKKKESSVPLRQNLAGKIESGQATRASILGSYGGGSGFVSKREYIFDMDVDALRLYPTTTLLKTFIISIPTLQWLSGPSSGSVLPAGP